METICRLPNSVMEDEQREYEDGEGLDEAGAEDRETIVQSHTVTKLEIPGKDRLLLFLVPQMKISFERFHIQLLLLAQK